MGSGTRVLLKMSLVGSGRGGAEVGQQHREQHPLKEEASKMAKETRAPALQEPETTACSERLGKMRPGNQKQQQDPMTIRQPDGTGQ